MKKYLLFLFVVVFTSHFSYAQLVPNGSFENWTIHHFFDEPNFGITTNTQTFLTTGTGNVQKTTDAFAGNFAAHLTTVLAQSDTIPGVIFLGTPSGSVFSGGIPVNVRPDSLKLYAKFDIMAGDTANVLVVFKKLGTYIGSGVITFTGNQSNYQLYKTQIYWTDSTTLPDTLVGIFSSSIFNDSSAVVGSNIYFDEVSFTGAAGTPSTGFEIWTSVESLEPDNWSTVNFVLLNQPPSVTRSNDAYDGLYAMQIENVVTSYGDTVGFATNGNFGGGSFFAGGMSVSQNPQTVTGYYKYNPVGADTALAAAYITKYDPLSGNTVRLDSALTYLTAANIYTPFTISLPYNGWPIADTLNITFAAGNYETDSDFASPGSILLIDKVEVQFNPVFVQPFEFQKAQNVYPNPANNMLNIINLKGNATQYFILLDAKGGKVFESNFNNRVGEISQLDISHVPNGFYMYQIIDGDHILKGKLTVVH